MYSEVRTKLTLRIVAFKSTPFILFPVDNVVADAILILDCLAVINYVLRVIPDVFLRVIEYEIFFLLLLLLLLRESFVVGVAVDAKNEGCDGSRLIRCLARKVKRTREENGFSKGGEILKNFQF